MEARHRQHRHDESVIRDIAASNILDIMDRFENFDVLEEVGDAFKGFGGIHR